MEPWTNEIKELYRTPGTYKEYRGYSNGELVFDGSNIVANSLNITQSISDSEQIRYGTVEASMLEVRLADSGDFPISIVPPSPIQLATDTAEPVYTAPPESKKYMLRTEELKGAEIELRQVIGEEEVPIGLFIVDECTREADTWFIKIVAYDRLYRFRQDVSSWYNDPATWPYALPEGNANMLGDLFASLCDYLGVPHDDLFISNDGKTIFKTVNPSSIPGTEVLSAMCELNGCWPQMSPEGILRRVRLGGESAETFDYEIYDQTYRPESTREDFVCKAINAVVIRETEDDIGGHYPETLQDNPYIIQDNFLVYGRSTADLEGFALNLYNTMKDKPYKPHRTIVDGRPYLQCGDKITVRTQKETFDTYILKRTLKGEASLVDSYEAQGAEKQEQEYGISRQIIQLKSKTNELTRTVDATVSTVSDIEAGMSTIRQDVNGISTEVAKKVGNDEIISRINQSAEAIKIAAAKIILEGIITANGNFKVLADGSIETASAKIAGSLDGVDGSFKSLVCDGGEIDFRVNGQTKVGIGIVNGHGAVLFSALDYIEYWSGSINIQGSSEVIIEGSDGTYIGDLYLPPSSVDSTTSSANTRLIYDGNHYRLAISSSSKKYKQRINPINEPSLSDMIDAVPAVTYESRIAHEKGRPSYGFIAEDMEQQFPWLAEYVVKDGAYEVNGVQYDRVPAILWADAQNTHAELKRQDAEIEGLKGKIAELKTVLATLLEGRADDGATLSE